MKKTLLGLLIAVIAMGTAWFFLMPHTIKPVATGKAIISPTVMPRPNSAISQQTLFVPYWSMQHIPSGYDTYVYFGITPDDQGIDTTEDGYVNLSSFAQDNAGKQTLLGVRILDKNLIGKILDDQNLQDRIIQDSTYLAQTYQFSGIVLDLEYSGLAFPNVTKSITDFSVKFAKEIKNQNLLYYQMFAGDTFYLARPFDVAAIAKVSDGIFIMGYDFHKANGTPGPNFPLSTLPDADYNFSDMTSDFSKAVPGDKMIIVFGLFGYDWTVDEQGRPEKTAESLTTQEIEKKFFPKCTFSHCRVVTNSAQEKDITYVDSANQRHVVWFEDMASVSIKESVVRRKDITKVAWWANGYF